ncbi:MAG: hypothetical protein JNJ49_00980 [Bdellovibrionaceae bacterium]|nr:hypothetical protein [Pseudobdellovibrionaceae bacterium]
MRRIIAFGFAVLVGAHAQGEGRIPLTTDYYVTEPLSVVVDGFAFGPSLSGAFDKATKNAFDFAEFKCLQLGSTRYRPVYRSTISIDWYTITRDHGPEFTVSKTLIFDCKE